jgi:hypothetical protein
LDAFFNSPSIRSKSAMCAVLVRQVLRRFCPRSPSPEPASARRLASARRDHGAASAEWFAVSRCLSTCLSCDSSRATKMRSPLSLIKDQSNEDNSDGIDRSFASLTNFVMSPSVIAFLSLLSTSKRGSRSAPLGSRYANVKSPFRRSFSLTQIPAQVRASSAKSSSFLLPTRATFDICDSSS